MAGALFLVIAALAGAAAVGLAWSQARRVRGATSGEATELERALRRVPAPERLATLLAKAKPGTWEHELAHDALEAESPEGRVAAVNGALGELEHTLSAGSEWPKAGIRIALLTAALLGAGAYLCERDQLRWSLSIVGIGAVAALASLEAGRKASRGAVAQREAVDRLVAVTLGGPFEGMPSRPSSSQKGAPERRRRRLRDGS